MKLALYVGQAVWFYPVGHAHTEQPFHGVIAWVNPAENKHNLGCLAHDGSAFAATGVEVLEEPGDHEQAWAILQSNDFYDEVSEEDEEEPVPENKETVLIDGKPTELKKQPF